MKYKMIISDFDGTIYSHRTFDVPIKVKKAIAEYIDKGGKFVLCTGRMYMSIKAHAQEIGLKGEILCLQGSVCYSLDTDEELFVCDISPETTYKLTTYLESNNWTYQFYHDLRMFTKTKNYYTDIYEQLADIKAVYTERNVSELIRENNYSAHKIIVMTTPETAKEKIEAISRDFPELEVTQSSAMFIEVVDKNSGKGNAVAKLAQKEGIPLSEVVVLGDETNDLSMLAVAGLACVPENAVDEAKSIADIIYPSVHIGGAGDLIRAIIDGKIE